MKNKTIFKGVATALITPLNEKGVDYDTLGRLIDWQIDEGINALVIAGTTGEGSTLDYPEHRDVLEYSVKRVAHRVPVIAGTGLNDTAQACELTKFSCDLGIDACLVVTPYYNKATQKGLVAMYKAIADASTKPIILYNVPSRTGVNIEPQTYLELSDHPMIAAIKEASGNIAKVVETRALVGDRLDIYSGNDDQIVPLLACGGMGVISVLSNVMPRATVEMCDKYFAGDVKGAMDMQCKFMPLVKALFTEVNPIPVKAAMAAMGFGENYLRLPLTPLEEAHEKQLLDVMKKEGLI